ncbi:amino acid ABC transporter ATP-binding protein [Klebsiella quasipneumoniae]|uniref:amino acid ABC transporter ATP-binding protein n=1 Tax=Klebsiella quasipneumoniae TaxID=1463165 RepID=UPI003B22BDCB
MPESIAVSVKNVSKQFDNVEVLRDINLTVEKGTVVSILGSSGSGKSTLLRCMNWLEQPDRGEIHIGGQRLGIDEQRGQAMSHRQLAKIRERVGMVFQSFNLWPHLTVQQNVSEALLRVKGMKRDEAQAMAMQQLEKVGMAHKADVYPITLSGGQKQRVAIARSLAMSPEVILFDEPTSALDPELVNEVLGVMKALAAEGYTMVVVTHEMDFARQVSNEVVFLEKGLLIEKAPPEKFFTQPDSERVRQFLQSSR